MSKCQSFADNKRGVLDETRKDLDCELEKRCEKSFSEIPVILELAF